MGIAVQFETLTQMFDNITKRFMDDKRPAYLRKVKGEWIGLSYKEYREHVKNFSLGLLDLGVKKGDNVALISENRVEWPISDLSILSIGAITVPIYPSLTAKQMEYILVNSDSKYLIISNQFQLNKINKIRENLPFLEKIIVMNEKIESEENVSRFSEILEAGKEYDKKNQGLFEELLKRTKPDDVATIIYTSGTTGEPKGVELTHKNFVFDIKAVASITEVNHKDISLSFLPLCHVFERMAGNYFVFGCGATISYADSIDTVAENLLEIKPTVMTTVPRLFERIYTKIQRSIDNSSETRRKIFKLAIRTGRKYAVAKKKGLISLSLTIKHRIAENLVFKKIRERTGGRLRFFVSGGAALPKEIGEFFEAIGLKILEGYGLTETSPVISINRINSYKYGSAGLPLPGLEVKIANDGEILTRGDHVMKGYYKNEKSTKEVIDDEGWFHTGDIGHMDPENFVMITDRKKNLFVSSGGKNIAPQPIENMFLSSKYIDQFVLIGDRRQFLSALIVPDFNAIKEYADMNRISYSDVKDLTSNEEIYNMIDQDISTIQSELANYEKVRRFVLLEKPLSLEEGEITPSLKIKRKVIEQKYSDIIENMYKK